MNAPPALDRFSERHLDWLVVEDPAALAALAFDPTAQASELTFVAEYLYRVPWEIAKAALLRLLQSPDAVVLEGALLGVSAQASDPDVRPHLVRLRAHASPTVHSFAAALLDEETP